MLNDCSTAEHIPAAVIPRHEASIVGIVIKILNKSQQLICENLRSGYP